MWVRVLLGCVIVLGLAIMLVQQFVNGKRLKREMARVQTAAQQESFERNGFKEYEYICCGMPDACDVCRALDGKVFKVKDMMVGENAPPMHPNCHCSTSAAAASREDFDAWLDAKAAGETDLGFEDWGRFNKNVKENPSTSNPSGGMMRMNLQFFASKEKQFGKKIGKHAQDFGLDPSIESHRQRMHEIIDDICKNAEVTKIGTWRGQDEEVLFKIKGKDVVITKQNGEFITILKNGVVNSARIKNARIKEV